MIIYLGVAVGLFLLIMLILRVDWTPGRYKVIYHIGPTVGIKTKMVSGRLSIQDGQIRIAGEKEFSLPLSSVRSVEILRLHGTGRMVRVAYDEDTLFVTAVRFCIAGQFASVDFFKAGKLAVQLSSLMQG